MKKGFAVLVCIAVAYASATPVTPKDGLSASKAIQKMASKIYLEEIKFSPDQNIVISPLSIHMAMSMLYYGAAGNSSTQLENALGLNGVQKTAHLEEVKSILDKYDDLDDNNTILNVANALFLSNDLQVKSEFKELVEEQFDAKIDALDFSDSDHSSEVINEWVAKKTNNLINKIVE